MTEPPVPAPGALIPFNVSEVIKDFLYVGAGFDEFGRCVTNLPHDGADPVQRSRRLAWFMQHNVTFALNMAGSPLQKEIAGLTYPRTAPGELEILSIDVNDLDTFDAGMAASFDAGAAFVQHAFLAAHQFKQKHAASSAAAGGGSFRSPSIFVHCVAGVNRSPFVVAWWLVKYHGFSASDAWDLVRKRRDVGVHWENMTMGGPISEVEARAHGDAAAAAGAAADTVTPDSPGKPDAAAIEEKKHVKSAWFAALKALAESLGQSQSRPSGASSPVPVPSVPVTTT